MQNKNSSVKVEHLTDPNHLLASCIRLSPYKKWSPPDNSRYKFTNSSSSTVGSCHNMPTPPPPMESKQCGNHLRSGNISTKERLYEPYSMRSKANNISIVNCKHISSSTSAGGSAITKDSQHDSHKNVSKTDFKHHNYSNCTTSQPIMYRSDTDQRHHTSCGHYNPCDEYLHTMNGCCRTNTNGYYSNSPSKSGYSNGHSKANFQSSLRINDLCENTLPMSPTKMNTISGYANGTAMSNSPIDDEFYRPHTRDEYEKSRRSAVKDSSCYVDEIDPMYSSPHRKLNNYHKCTETSNHNQSTVREIRKTKPAYNVGIVEMIHNDYTPQKNIKCGNASCNGSEPLKETHITNTAVTTSPVKLHTLPTFNIEKRYREEVAAWRGKIKDMNKQLVSNDSADVNRKEEKSPTHRSHSNQTTPVRKTVRRNSISKQNSKLISEPTMALSKRIPDDKTIEMDLEKSPPKTGLKMNTSSPQSLRRFTSTPSPPPQTVKIENHKMDDSCELPTATHSEQKTSPLKTVDNSLQSVEFAKQSSITTVSPQKRLVSGGDNKSNGDFNPDTNVILNGVIKKEVKNSTSRRVHSKTKKKTKTDLNNDSSESELSDSECSGPDEADTEEKNINYETVLNELKSIRQDLSRFNKSIKETSLPGSGDNTINTIINTSSVLRSSLFPHVPPYIKFSSHDVVGPKLPATIQRQLKWNLSNITPIIVRKTLINSGFKLIRAEAEGGEWIGVWGKHLKSPCYKSIKEYQKINHFPGTFQLGRKDRLWRNTQRLQLKYGMKEFDYVPKTFILPHDLKHLRHTWEKGEGISKWILKPPASSRGTGIRVVNKWNQVPKKRPLVVQRYIENPYLINGSKFDLRLYVLITSVDPLRVYLYPDGFARFASVKYSYDSSTLDNRYIHLTNYSINKLSKDYTANEDAGACQGHKWSIQALWDYLGKSGVNTEELWSSIRDIVIKTVISSESGITHLIRQNVSSRYNCYELFGIDILLDENLKPWILEVNISPSMHSSTALDIYVKGPLIQTLLNMAQYHIPNDKLSVHQRHHVIKALGLQQSKNQFIKSTSPPPLIRSSGKLAAGSDIPTQNVGAAGDDDTYDVPLGFDPRIYTKNLTQQERTKQFEMTSYQQRSDYLDDILRSLTPDDIRHLIIAEDELQAAGKFEKIFPTKDTYHYLGYMEPRYYDRLFDAWEHKYSSNRHSGINLLKAYCSRKYHLTVPPPAKIYKENSMEENSKKETEEENPVAVAQQNVEQSSLSISVQPSTNGQTVTNNDGVTAIDTDDYHSLEGPSPSRKPRKMKRKYRYGRIGFVIKKYPGFYDPSNRVPRVSHRTRIS